MKRENKIQRKIQKIILPYGGIKKMAESLKCDRTTIEEALRFTRETELQDKIRREAVEFYKGRLIKY